MNNNNKIKKARKRAGLTQEQCARALNISLRYFQMIESGKSRPNVDLAIKLAELLKSDAKELFN